ncbi:MAG: glucose-6-phosphate isomerase [Firmicutes bacterium]|nr:glucose-6-phosphate isomerase [Bacillota bacterium]
MIKVITDGVGPFGIEPDMKKAKAALASLKDGSCKGNDFLGWLKLPEYIGSEEYARVKACGKKIYDNADALVVIGIGGSYLGARAALEFICSQRFNETGRKGPKVYFLGNGINAADTLQVLELVKGKSLYVNVISKSGTTLEPAVSFRIFKKYLEDTYGKEEASKRIVATTDARKGALKGLADAEGYECFVVPDNVGGRYSVLTAVGLLPLAAAGIDTDAILKGAKEAEKYCLAEREDNPALLYAAYRQAVYENGKKVEVLSVPSESVRFFAEWWKQLYGESDGKDGKGIFPASCVYTADLHSMGQYIQEGERILFETGLSFENISSKLVVPTSEDNADGLNYLAGKDFSEIYNAARDGVKKAHIDGGVPCLEIRAEKQDEVSLGELIFFFETACGISAIMSGVNPFNQPGVEAYKSNMFALLGRK